MCISQVQSQMIILIESSVIPVNFIDLNLYQHDEHSKDKIYNTPVGDSFPWVKSVMSESPEDKLVKKVGVSLEIARRYLLDPENTQWMSREDFLKIKFRDTLVQTASFPFCSITEDVSVKINFSTVQYGKIMRIYISSIEYVKCYMEIENSLIKRGFLSKDNILERKHSSEKKEVLLVGYFETKGGFSLTEVMVCAHETYPKSCAEFTQPKMKIDCSVKNARRVLGYDSPKTVSDLIRLAIKDQN